MERLDDDIAAFVADLDRKRYSKFIIGNTKNTSGRVKLRFRRCDRLQL
jgi:hypothetical protein